MIAEEEQVEVEVSEGEVERENEKAKEVAKKVASKGVVKKEKPKDPLNISEEQLKAFDNKQLEIYKQM